MKARDHTIQNRIQLPTSKILFCNFKNNVSLISIYYLRKWRKMMSTVFESVEYNRSWSNGSTTALALQPFIIMMHFSVRKLYLHSQKEECLDFRSFRLEKRFLNILGIQFQMKYNSFSHKSKTSNYYSFEMRLTLINLWRFSPSNFWNQSSI